MENYSLLKREVESDSVAEKEKKEKNLFYEIKFMIRIENLVKNYYIGKTQVVKVLKWVNLHIKKWEFVSIMGPSGSGKSTLMNIIGMLDTPTSGKYFLNDVDVFSLKAGNQDDMRWKNIGFVFQWYNLIKRHSSLNQVMLPLSYQAAATNKKQRAIEALNKVGLDDKIDSLPNELSWWQQQRVAIARALVIDPLLLLCDEPTGALDTKTGKEVMELFTKLNKEGKTIVMITHDEEIANYATRIIRIRDGVIEE